jgi:hypothetical protein
MQEHQLILRKILIIASGLVLGISLIGIAFEVEKEPGYLAFSGVAVMAILGFTSARWIITAIEAVTGLTFFLSVRALLLLFTMGMVLAPLILPLGLAILLVQYLLARRRCLREASPSS